MRTLGGNIPWEGTEGAKALGGSRPGSCEGQQRGQHGTGERESRGRWGQTGRSDQILQETVGQDFGHRAGMHAEKEQGGICFTLMGNGTVRKYHLFNKDELQNFQDWCWKNPPDWEGRLVYEDLSPWSFFTRFWCYPTLLLDRGQRLLMEASRATWGQGCLVDSASSMPRLTEGAQHSLVEWINKRKSKWMNDEQKPCPLSPHGSRNQAGVFQIYY